MKQSIALLIATTALFTQVGCSNSSATKGPERTPDSNGQAAPSVDYVDGAYGFVLDSEGNYQIGEGADPILSGKLTLSEQEQFKAALVPYKAKPTQKLSKESCEATAEDDAKTLCQVVVQLHAKYYPLNIPADACINAARALNKAQADVTKGCTVNTDCSLVNSGYTPMTEGHTDFVFTDNCTWSRALGAANTAALQNSQANLMDQAANLRYTCGAQTLRYQGCAAIGFQSTAVSAVCDAGVCKVSN